MQDVFGYDFQNNRISSLLGNLNCFLNAASQIARDTRDTIGFKHNPGFVFANSLRSIHKREGSLHFVLFNVIYCHRLEFRLC